MPIVSLNDLKNQPKQQPPSGGGGNPFQGFGGGGGRAPSAPESKNIKHLRGDDSALVSELKKAGGKLVVVYFTASWCGPCQMISPRFSQIADTYTDVVFIKIDVDEAPDIASSRGVKSMPTFQFYKNNSKLIEFSGADPTRLQSEIEKHKTPSSSSSSSSQPSSMSGGSYMLGGSAANPNPIRPISERVVIPDDGEDLDDNDLLRSKYGRKGSSTAAKAEVNPIFVTNLMEMGFTRSQATKGLDNTGGKSIESAMDWCINHPQDPEEEKKEREEEASYPKTESSTTPNGQNNSNTDVVPMETDNSNVKTPLTEEEKKAKLDALLEKRRAEKAKDEADRELERELTRRATGKDVTESKRLWEENKMQREQLARQKEKEDDAKAKKAIKDKLEQDRRERIAQAEARSGKTATATVVQEQQPVTSTTEKKEYTKCAIQIRFQSGNNIRASFSPEDTLQTVHDHVATLHGNPQFSLLSNFPKKVYSPEDPSSMRTTLKQADLVPSGTLMLTKL